MAKIHTHYSVLGGDREQRGWDYGKAHIELHATALGLERVLQGPYKVMAEAQVEGQRGILEEGVHPAVWSAE
jgi:hypothetical protein